MSFIHHVRWAWTFLIGSKRLQQKKKRIWNVQSMFIKNRLQFKEEPADSGMLLHPLHISVSCYLKLLSTRGLLPPGCFSAPQEISPVGVHQTLQLLIYKQFYCQDAGVPTVFASRWFCSNTLWSLSLCVECCCLVFEVWRISCEKHKMGCQTWPVGRTWQEQQNKGFSLIPVIKVTAACNVFDWRVQFDDWGQFTVLYTRKHRENVTALQLD